MACPEGRDVEGYSWTEKKCTRDLKTCAQLKSTEMIKKAKNQHKSSGEFCREQSFQKVERKKECIKRLKIGYLEMKNPKLV